VQQEPELRESVGVGEGRCYSTEGVKTTDKVSAWDGQTASRLYSSRGKLVFIAVIQLSTNHVSSTSTIIEMEGEAYNPAAGVVPCEGRITLSWSKRPPGVVASFLHCPCCWTTARTPPTLSVKFSSRPHVLPAVIDRVKLYYLACIKI